ncbi:MAG: hypothetical protein J6D47_04080 [Peptostreptococcaceae bacterium]|nr:hypothetical protein [Peptostreptococcaceae bacterium]
MKSKVVKKAIEVTCIVGISVLVSLGVNVKINKDIQSIESNMDVIIDDVNKNNSDILTLEDKYNNLDRTINKEAISKEHKTKSHVKDKVDVIKQSNKKDTNINKDNTVNENTTINEDTKQFTEEDVQRYKEYKESLINEYGEDVYNLMNQEAGIENEEQSFYHFMEYGI